MPRPLRGLLLFSLICALLQGCSAVRLGYANADKLALWWIDQYVDTSPEQDALARERLARLHAWHRRTQLPDYVVLLRQGSRFVSGPPTTADALALGDGIVRRGQALAEQALPDIADFLATLGPAQIERMAARFAERNAEFERETRLGEDEGAQRKARYKQVLERTEYWFGSLDDAQDTALRKLLEAHPTDLRFRHEERQRRQREWLELARQVQREHPPRPRVVQMLRDYAGRFDQPADPVRLARSAALRRTSAELTAAIVALATPTQRAHARQRLDDLIRDFTELSQEG